MLENFPGIGARFASLSMLLAMSLSAQANHVQVTVIDRDGKPVPNIAVFAESPSYNSTTEASVPAVMDQVDVRFKPHILVVQKGTAVEFPNNDVIAHHVYSFSKPNDFRLPIYKGDRHPPVSFDAPGVVTLGCNIHDGMLAYILVVDSPWFSKTDANGSATLATSGADDLAVRVWSPRLRDADSNLRRKVEFDEHGNASVRIELGKKLRRSHEHDTDAVKWNEY